MARIQQTTTGRKAAGAAVLGQREMRAALNKAMERLMPHYDAQRYRKNRSCKENKES